MALHGFTSVLQTASDILKKVRFRSLARRVDQSESYLLLVLENERWNQMVDEPTLPDKASLGPNAFLSRKDVALNIKMACYAIKVEIERLQLENNHLKKVLDFLHRNIILGEATHHRQLRPPDDRRNTTFLTESTDKANQIYLRIFGLENTLEDIQRTISQLTSTITGENRSEDSTQDNTNTLTATGRQPNRNHEREIVQSEQSSTIYNDIELIRSAWLTLKNNERELLTSTKELENKIQEYEQRGIVDHHTQIAWENPDLEWEAEKAYREKEKADLQRRIDTIEEYIRAHENVSIADLSDADRPTRLGHVYTELYENEFTEAVEELTNHDTITENDAFMILLKILMNSFQNCRAMTWGRYEKLINVASSLDIEQESPLSSVKYLECTIDLTSDLTHDIMGIWRKATLDLKEIAAEELYSVIETCLDMPLDVQPMTSNYLKRCIDLCWKMGVQERPLHLDGFAEIDAYAGKEFDTEKFDPRARSGSHVAFVVWPTLYLHEGGPVIAKGIAQCCSPDETESEESS